MKKHEEIMVKSSRLIEHTCDICCKDIRNKGYYDCDSAEIDVHIGPIYPGGDACQEHYFLEMCTDCFLNRVKPLFEQELNVKFQYRED